MPSVLVYQLKAANNRSSMDWKEKLDTSILFHDLRYVFSTKQRVSGAFC